jgi:hypothetical protein
VNTSANSDPFQSIGPTLLPPIQPRNSRQERRLQNRADEKANWLLLNEGDLTGETGSFGVNDKQYTAEGLEKEETSRNYTFHNLTKQNRNSGKPSPEMLRQMQKSKQDLEFDSSFDKGDKSPSSLHTASALNFKKLFDPGSPDKNVLGPAKTDFSMQGFFTPPSPSFDTKAQENHSAKFNEFLRGPAAVENSPSPFQRGGLDAKAASPALDITPKGPANNPFFTAPAGSAPSSVFSTPGADPNYGRANPFSPPPVAPTYREPARNFAPSPNELPRRNF